MNYDVPYIMPTKFASYFFLSLIYETFYPCLAFLGPGKATVKASPFVVHAKHLRCGVGTHFLRLFVQYKISNQLRNFSFDIKKRVDVLHRGSFYLF